MSWKQGEGAEGGAAAAQTRPNNTKHIAERIPKYFWISSRYALRNKVARIHTCTEHPFNDSHLPYMRIARNLAVNAEFSSLNELFIVKF